MPPPVIESPVWFPWLVKNGALMVTGGDVATTKCGECCDGGGGGGDECCSGPGPCGTATLPWSATVAAGMSLETEGLACDRRLENECCRATGCVPLGSGATIVSGYPPRSIDLGAVRESTDNCAQISVSGEATNHDGLGGCESSGPNILRASIQVSVGLNFGAWTLPTAGVSQIIVSNFEGTVHPPPGSRVRIGYDSGTKWGGGVICGEGRQTYASSHWQMYPSIEVRGGFFIAMADFRGFYNCYHLRMSLAPSLSVDLLGSGECISGASVTASISATKTRECRAPAFIPDSVSFGASVTGFADIGRCPGESLIEVPRKRVVQVGFQNGGGRAETALEEMRRLGLVRL